jgi:hypothetical protein
MVKIKATECLVRTLWSSAGLFLLNGAREATRLVPLLGCGVEKCQSRVHTLC